MRKAQIRAAAAYLIGERGLSHTRVEDVAARAGTSKAAVLYWFGGKDELLAEALRLQDEVFYGELTQRMASLESAGQRLRLVGEMFLFRYEYRLWMQLCVHALNDPATADVRLSFDRRWRELIARTIAEGQEGGEFESGDAQELAVRLAALLDGLSMQVTLADPAVPRDDALAIWLRAAEDWLGATLEAAPDLAAIELEAGESR
ncbi:MAG TPA: TetR/AcrR family transcriptional regulator [Thermoleophilaceae bacterium]|nr:TetR/AcrR family transcriptional regulator [Thermoleophilaceae bacterium]